MGGPGSGRFPAGSGSGHSGRPGARGGSVKGGKGTKGKGTPKGKGIFGDKKNRYVPFPLLPKDNAKLAKSGKYAG
jgi:hypothetical protein